MLVYLTILISCAFGQFSVYWQGSQMNNTATSRNTNLSIIDGGLYYQSLQQSGNGDGCFGSVSSLQAFPLVSYLAYFNKSSGWTGSSHPSTADISAANSFIGLSYLAITELEANGTVLGSFPLVSLDWNISQVQSDGPMQHATFRGEGSGNFLVNVTFVTSDSTGALTNGAILTPESIQMFINLIDYNFTSPTSRLRLTLAVAMASSSMPGPIAMANGLYRLSSGSGNSTIYFEGSSNSWINGTSESVMINTSVATTTDFDNSSFLQQLNGLRQAQPSLAVNYTLVNITFPNPDYNITYAASIGMGTFNVTNVNGGSSGMSGIGGSGSSGSGSGMSGSGVSGSGTSSGMSGSGMSGMSSGMSGMSSGMSGSLMSEMSSGTSGSEMGSGTGSTGTSGNPTGPLGNPEGPGSSASMLRISITLLASLLALVLLMNN